MSQIPDRMIILYSKYSIECKRVLEVVHNVANHPFELVCIDNVQVRKRLERSKTFSIHTVPCVVLMYPSNEFEKYEGKGITEWIFQELSDNSGTDVTEIQPQPLPPSSSTHPSTPLPHNPNPPMPMSTQNPPPTMGVGVGAGAGVSNAPSAPMMGTTPLMMGEVTEPMGQTIPIDVSEPKPKSTGAKSITEMAAEMAAARKEPDGPPHMMGSI